MSRNWVKDIFDMHSKFGLRPDKLTGEFLKFRINFIKEECNEMDDAIFENDPEKFVDALIDMAVVIIGTLDVGGIDSYKAWNAVHRANMSKERANNPNRQGSAGFDLIKPEGWKPPNHKGNTGNFDTAIQELFENSVARAIVNEQELPTPSHIHTLQEYIAHAMRKTHDYDDMETNDPEFAHFSYYPNGIRDIMYEIAKKVKRINHGLKRLMKTGRKPLTDGLDDSFRDISIYSAIGNNIVNGTLEGQDGKDMFNRDLDKKWIVVK